VLLSDCMSPIYPENGIKFFNDMRNIYNIKICTTDTYLK